MPNKVRIELEWENDDFFEMTSKVGDGNKMTVVRIEENAHIEDLWKSISDICNEFFSRKIKEIGVEMKV